MILLLSLSECNNESILALATSKIMVYDVTELRMPKIIIFELNDIKDDFLLSVTRNIKNNIF